ncbi:MAG: hypothetical protein ABFS34_04900 [Gemmatimonadota bacterium]
MRRVTLLVWLAFIAAGAAAGSLNAQDEERPVVYASYWDCGTLANVVDLIAQDWGPLMQTHMDGGAITAWGAATHKTGNSWDLLLYYVGSDYEAITSALQSSGQQLAEENPETFETLGNACPSHEDYVWISAMSSAPVEEVAQERAEAALSIYWVCDEGVEAAADLIFEEMMMPALEAQVEAGLVNSWSWNEHFLGGKYRRLLALDGPTHASLLEARNGIIDAFNENPGLSAAFSRICNGHQDNLYDIAISVP